MVADHDVVGVELTGGEDVDRTRFNYYVSNFQETVMRKHGYDQYAEHKADHEKLLDDLRDIMDAYDARASVDYEAALSSAVRDWFVNHFKTKDARLHRLLGV